MTIRRILGGALLFGALAAFAAELIRWLRDGAYRPLALGEFWTAVDANSLVGFGRLVEAYVSPALWSGVLVPLLALPVWLVLGLPGGLLFAFGGRRRHRRFGRR